MRSRVALILLGTALLPACGGSGKGGVIAPPPPLAGNYFRTIYSANGSGSQDVGRAGTATFVAEGTYSETTTVNTNGLLTAGSDNGTMTVGTDGSFSWVDGAANVYSGGTQADGKLAISGASGAGTKPLIAVDIQKGSGFTNASLSGTYYNVGYAFRPAASPYHYTITGLLTVDGVGSWTTTMTGNSEGTINSGSNTGTYSVAADGGVTLADSATSFIGSLTGGGDLLLLGTFTAGQRVEIVISAKKAGAFTASSLQGDYRVVSFGSSPPGHNHFSTTATCTFDGVGSAVWTGIQNTEGVITSLNGMTESFSIAADGTLTITNSGIGGGLTLTGGVVNGGGLAVVSAVTAGNRLETRLYIRK